MFCLQLHVCILFINIIDALVPEVSQEGLLQPYVTYSDVSLFHYHVPPEVQRVTWEFAAFMDDPSCPVRDVHVLIQHGSYPVFSIENNSFPSYMYNGRSSLQKIVTKTAYQPHDATLLSVSNPLPGSWFAAAYIPHWNEQMQQEGLVHKCRYSLGSVAMWTQKDRIKTLNIGLSQTVSTEENFSCFRFYVPSHTWLLQVNISNCKIRSVPPIVDNGVNETSSWCIRSLSLSARSLPEHPDDNGIANISEGSGHIFVEKHPYSDSYYYLLMYTETQTDMVISIATKECGNEEKNVFSSNNIRSSPSETPLPSQRSTSYVISVNDTEFNVFENNQTTEDVSNSTETNSSDGEQNKVNFWSEMVSKIVPNDDKIQENNVDEHRCFPVLPLARIKHSRDFTDTFLVQGPEWFSSWVSVHGETPLFTHMTLLPYTDIGGTLSITLHMDELLMNATNQIISVNGCVKKGRPPLVLTEGLECEEALKLNISTMSALTVKDFLLIPFPEPDVWYLALHLVCYSSGERSPCVINHVMVSIDVRTQPCVYAGEQPCGNHGVCQETHRGMFFFSTCICQHGWRGWGCHDGQHAQGWPSFMSGICLLTISNVFFLPAIVRAAILQFYTQALLFSATMVSSILYHACDSEVFRYCFARFEVLQFCDFFFSLMCFWVTVVSMYVPYSEKEMAFLHILGTVIIAPLVQYSRTALISFMLPMGVAITITVSKVLCHRVRFGMWPSISTVRLLVRCLGIVFALSGLCLFAFVQDKANYKFVHSTWHMFIALSLMFLLPSKRPSRKYQTDTLFGCVNPCDVGRVDHSVSTRFDESTLYDDGDDVSLLDPTDLADPPSPVFHSSTTEGVDTEPADVDLIVFGTDQNRDSYFPILNDDNPM